VSAGFTHVIYNAANTFFENVSMCTFAQNTDYSYLNTWLFNVHTALPALIGTFVFILGFVMVLVMAEVAAIPLELYEAAQVDGATPFQQHRRITVPLLRNVLGTCVLITLLGYLALFDIVYILTAGGPGNGTVTLVLYGYRIYTSGDWGYANAIGTFIVLTGALLIVIVRRLFRIGDRDL